MFLSTGRQSLQLFLSLMLLDIEVLELMLEHSPEEDAIISLKATEIYRGDANEMNALLAKSAAQHHKLCPRQVLGVRIGLFGVRKLGLDIPRRDKRLLVFVETDGCFISGVEAATGCSVNQRTMRILDYGKVAAVFVDVITGKAVRVAPKKDIRERVWDFALPEETSRYHVMLHGYQVMPDDLLLISCPVVLHTPLSEIIGRPGVRVNCDQCEEEIINGREIKQDGKTYCQGCAVNKNIRYRTDLNKE